MRTSTIFASAALILLSACKSTSSFDDIAVSYPETPKQNVSDTYFGTEVADPYRWLEDDRAPEVEAWVDAQNVVTQSYLSQIPFRDKIRNRLTEVYNYPRIGQPFRIKERYYFYKNDGLQNQSVLYVQDGLEGTPRVYFDPNKLSEDGTVTARMSSVSPDKKFAVMSVNRAGSDRQEFYVMDVESGEFTSDTVKMAKFSGTSWYHNGFFYSAYGNIRGNGENSLTAKNEYHTVYYHRLGTKQKDDVLIFKDRENPLRNYGMSVTEDERFQFLYGSQGTSGTSVQYRDTERGDLSFNPLFPGFEHEYSVVDHLNGQLMVHTNYGAPNWRLVLVDPNMPEPESWQNIIPEKDELLEQVSYAGEKLFARYLKNVTSEIQQYATDGTLERTISLPALGTVSGFGGEKEDKELFYTFTSFTYPPTVYRYNIASGESTLFQKADVKVDPEAYETKQVFYTSKDGTKVPMFIVHKKGLKLNGTAPTYLYAYGGFNISLKPSFSTSRFVLLENGGVFAMANLRGGGEFGENWHKGGMLNNKQNVFDDFIAAAEYLVTNKYTSTEKLAIAGGSNGGLLVGAVMTQRPALVKVAFPAVGVMDMLRYHKFTIGWAWGVEYGTSEESEASFRNLYGYSPVHNVREGIEYPATMVTTADHDDRVVPAHSFKFIAELQEKHEGENPVLIRIDKDAGHGAGKPTEKIIDEQADIWSFMFYNMGVEPYPSM